LLYQQKSQVEMTERPPICDYEGSDYQTSFWEQGGREYEDQVEAVALRRLLPSSGDLMLEVGAGAGRNTPRYSSYERVVLMDYSLSQLQRAQTRLGRNHRYMYVAADVYRLPFVDSLFDGATMIRVLHHLSEPLVALSQIRRVMQVGGVFLLEFANKRNLKAIARYLLRRQDWSPFTPEPVEFARLNYDFHPHTVRKWLTEADFELQRQLTVSHFRIGFLKRLVPTRLLVGLDSLAQWTGNLWQLTPSVFTKSTAASPSVSGNSPGGFFQCPTCGQALPEQAEDTLTCQGCGARWPIVDEIFDFRGRE
jgi:ubiquinone/menaquinone biosynthesis C-methylase UbiE